MNWFRTGEGGQFLWPGFGENLRVLKWILERCEGRGEAVETAIGAVPTPDAIDRQGLHISDDGALGRCSRWIRPSGSRPSTARRTSSARSAPICPKGLWDEQRDLAHRIEEMITPNELRGRDSGL